MTTRPNRRVAYLLTQSQGGPVDVTVELARAVAQRPGWEVKVFGPRPARGAERIAHLHEEVLVGGKFAAAAIVRARRRIRAWTPDVVHAQDRRSGLVGVGMARRGGRPAVVVHTYHGVPDDVGQDWFSGEDRPEPSRYTRAVLTGDALVARATSRTVVPSPSMGRFLVDRLHVPRERITHIDNGLALPPRTPRTGLVRNLLFVGLLVRRKGVHLLLDALTDPALPPGVELTIAGSGPEEAALKAQAARAGLQGRVRFLGFRTDVPELLARCDALVLPSSMEQQPLVVIEAMATGRVVVATDVGGLRDTVGEAGVLIPPDDVSALRRALVDLTSSTVDTAVREDEAAARARRAFGVQGCADQHLALYTSLLPA
ncbi:glycosyltransferase family 4 protein [Kineococcus rhizosphaerae]|uniref:Glycosyltransferase involved in cell wall biosynthesis n=1 Tax=Kineococcus rhizosphaerae TaxID=559628 RepID=A0A2T0RBB5_9ACTN|nr:glycosyltransferase family 4 protein [Kineococcus rhizosphaerae]PRY18430.1 glycosyltransferase involved in cell wall biosynthesis [Kineococcus rhizosphaerae]